MSKTAYISSTYKDLKEYRDAVYKALRKIRYDVVCMEDYVATDERNVEKCCAHASGCDIYIGIFARRYGYIPPDMNPSGVSITEMEYRAARSSPHTKVRAFLLDEDSEWPETEPESPASQEKLKSLRWHISQLSYGPFRTTSDLVEQVLAAVYTVEAEARVEPGLDDIRSADIFPLESSGLLMIATKMQAAITNSASVAGLQVNLGSGAYWWSTRLYLVAALMEEYTSISEIVFFGGEKPSPTMPVPLPPPMLAPMPPPHSARTGYPYLGMCSPVDVRRALASHFRNVDRAYHESVPDQVFDAAAEVPQIVDSFGKKVASLAPAGERDVMRFVATHVVEQWRGFNADRIEVANRKVDGVLLDDIVAKRSAYVALVRDGSLDTLIDRAELATNLALRRH